MDFSQLKPSEQTDDIEALVWDAVNSHFAGRGHTYENKAPKVGASSAGACSRQIAYATVSKYYTDAGIAKETHSVGSMFNFGVGTWYHEQLEEALAADENFKDFQWEIEWETEYLRSRADGLYTDNNGEKVLCEFKSAGAKSFYFVQRSGVPRRSTILQAQISAHALKAQWILIVYLRKESAGRDDVVRAFLLPYNEDDAEAEIQRLSSIVKGVVDARRIPAPEYEGDILDKPRSRKFPCAWCAYLDQCDEAGTAAYTMETKGETNG